MRKLLYFLITLFVVVLLSACGQGQQNTTDNNTAEQVEIKDGEKPVVTMVMDNGGEIVIELYPEVAPKTVENFVQLVEQGFYDGLTFHRVIPGFMIQGGDPSGDGTGGSGETIPGEFESNGYDNPLLHEEGVISMARSQDPDSASSQFFIMDADSPHLDGDYAAFGKVISGMEVVHEIANVERGRNDKPVDDQVISQMTVELTQE
ncbi:peptidylprolyl isomerase [Gracilibacillus oryzae]|uniref:Peptidyl-prolyl cis-trans isomerase n=1 Tax=Gracilibacillus oryzae TaxID=1672701 RepID=A0A7C8L034_9BACI|nr:peptidylprolyl isomerase [Gracilibacillus oryzae]KAB8137816.1 peptidylprolyl isomerase [Gracilibacillus oryzae]